MFLYNRFAVFKIVPDRNKGIRAKKIKQRKEYSLLIHRPQLRVILRSVLKKLSCNQSPAEVSKKVISRHTWHH